MILSAMKSAILRLTGVSVQEVFASTDNIAVEIADLVNEVATEIMLSHDWRALTKVHQIAGDGSTAYPLPDDYDRMVLASNVDDATSWFWGYEQYTSVNEWMRYSSGSYGLQSPGGWIIMGGEFVFSPAPNGTAQFPYISDHYARDNDGTLKSEFTSDDDTFLLDNRLLTLGLIWRWQSQKGMDYSESMQSYEIALAREQARDGGANVLRSPRGYRLGGNVAYNNRAIR